MDLISDFITRIRNAQLTQAESLEARYSKLSEDLAKVLAENGFIKSFEVISEKKIKKLKVYLKYVDEKPAITEIKRVSKPGVRRYIKYTEIRPVVSGFGIMVLTTPKGVMTAKKAKVEKCGGEILCLVW